MPKSYFLSQFLSVTSLHCTSKDLNSCPSYLPPSFFIETKSWQKLKSWKTKNSQRIPRKISPNFSKSPQISPQNSQNIPKKFQRNSRINKKFPRFWKYPIPYIAHGVGKPFRACWCEKPTEFSFFFFHFLLKHFF